MLRFLVFLAACVSFVGCAGTGASPEPVQEVGIKWDEGAIRDHLRQLTTVSVPEDSAQAARRATYAARRMNRFGLMPARDPSFFLRMGGTEVSLIGPTEIAPTEAHIAGYVAGRHPSRYDELVLVAADLDRPGAAAVLEAARALVAEARYTQTPERSVLFVLWAPPRTGALGLGDFLANPTWALRNVRRVLLVTTDSTTVTESQRVLGLRDIPAEVVVVEDRSVAGAGARPEIAQARRLARTLRLTDALYARIIATTTESDRTVSVP